MFGEKYAGLLNMVQYNKSMPKHRTPPTKKPKSKDEVNLYSVPVTPLYKLNHGSSKPTQKQTNPYSDERDQGKKEMAHSKDHDFKKKKAGVVQVPAGVTAVTQPPKKKRKK